MIWVLIISMIIIVTDLIGASLMADSAEKKGYGSDYHIALLCFFLGPFGYWYALSLPDLVIHEQNQKIIDLLSKKNDSQSEDHKRADEHMPELPPL